MQRKELRLKSRTSEEVQSDEQQRMARMRMHRGEGSKSSPMRHLKPLLLSHRSQSEGNLVAERTFDLKSHREVAMVQNEQTLQLPKLHQDKSQRTGLPSWDNPELKRNTAKDISRETLTTLAINDKERTRMLKMHIDKEENDYHVDETKRKNLLRWLSEQKKLGPV